MEEKDLNAFRMVIAKTGQPSEANLIAALRRVVDIYRPSFDEESAGNPMANTRILWQELFRKDIDVREQIISPALALRRESYGGSGPSLKQSLESLGTPAARSGQPPARSEPRKDSP